MSVTGKREAFSSAVANAIATGSVDAKGFVSIDPKEGLLLHFDSVVINLEDSEVAFYNGTTLLATKKLSQPVESLKQRITLSGIKATMKLRSGDHV